MVVCRMEEAERVKVHKDGEEGGVGGVVIVSESLEVGVVIVSESLEVGVVIFIDFANALIKPVTTESDGLSNPL